jgi:hypothetical protein
MNLEQIFKRELKTALWSLCRYEEIDDYLIFHYKTIKVFHLSLEDIYSIINLNALKKIIIKIRFLHKYYNNLKKCIYVYDEKINTINLFTIFDSAMHNKIILSNLITSKMNFINNFISFLNNVAQKNKEEKFTLYIDSEILLLDENSGGVMDKTILSLNNLKKITNTFLKHKLIIRNLEKSIQFLPIYKKNTISFSCDFNNIKASVSIYILFQMNYSNTKKLLKLMEKNSKKLINKMNFIIFFFLNKKDFSKINYIAAKKINQFLDDFHFTIENKAFKVNSVLKIFKKMDINNLGDYKKKMCLFFNSF